LTAKDYIASGILERYLLGELSDAENAEVIDMAQKHHEILQEINAIEMAMIQLHHIPVPEKVKTKLFATLDSVEKETKTVSIKPNIFQRPWLAAASLLLLAGSLIYNIYLNGELSKTKNALADLKKEKNEFLVQLTTLKSDADLMANELSMVHLPESKKVYLKALDSLSKTYATVFWNQKNHEVYINAKNMPQPDDQHQYQLWALVDGQPVDMGVFDITKDPYIHLQKMKSISKVQTFAVTLEKKGGSPSPNLQELKIIGNV
jgi:hypothetical protein